VSLNLQALLDAVVSHVAASGHFDRVNTHEPKSAPGSGVTAAVWVESIGPATGASGLAATTARVVLNMRLFTSMFVEPQDAIDPNLTAALDALFDAYSGDLELGGNVRNIDLLGQQGVPMSALAGYVSQDQKLYRIYTITLPLVVNDIWQQGA
jgi:hypothetical protein